MVNVTVDSRVRIPDAALSRDVAHALKRTCEHDNPDWHKAVAIGRNPYAIPKVVKTWRVEGGCITLPSGAMARARAVLRAAGVKFSVADERSEGIVVSARRPLTYVGKPLRAYQHEMIDRAFEKERCVIRAATGSGKTTAAFALAAKVGLNTLVILPNAKLLAQWLKRAKSDLGLDPRQVGVIRGPKRTLRPLTLATQQTLWRRDVDDELREFFGCVIIDEGHHAAARTFMHTIDSFPARYRVAFTADERRKDRKEFIVYDLVGDVAHEVSREECEDTGAIVDVEVRVVFSDFAHDDYRFDSDFNALLDAMTADERRNALAVYHALEEIAGGEQVLLFTHRREHARDLERFFIAKRIPSGCLLGDQEAGDDEEFERTCEGLIDGKVRVACGTYQAAGEGIDLPAVSVGIATTPIWTNKQTANQVRGRLCRSSTETGKTHGRLYTIFDPRVFDEKVLRNIVSWNKTVRVRVGGEWVEGKAFLKEYRGRMLAIAS